MQATERPASHASAAAPLRGVRVIDLGQYIAGPGAAMVLGELGADVIKIEPLGGDQARHIGRYGESMVRAYNRGKRSIALDLKREEGLRVALRLIADADVVVQNLRPGAVDRLGLGPDEYVNATIAFDPFDASNGSLEIFSGLQRQRLPAPPGSPFDADEAALEGCRSDLLELAPGDVVLFHSMLPHRSGQNRGTRSRRGLFLTYVPSRYAGLNRRYEQGRVDRPK